MAKASNGSTYISNEGKPNQRIHQSTVHIKNIINRIKYNVDLEIPKELIKFYRINLNSCNALINNYLWAANPVTFNDPFDCSIQLWKDESFTKENLLKLTDPKAHHLFKDDEQYNFQLFRDIRIPTLGIICLHEFKVSSQDILWGYYTDQQGFSIKLNTQELLRRWEIPFFVEYLPHTELDFFSLNEINNVDDLFARFLRWTTQKKSLWNGENEWRFIFSNLKTDTLKMDASPKERMKKYPLNALIEVVLGLKFFDEANSVCIENDDFYFITDSIKHQEHNLILTHLSEHQNIPTLHMFFLRNKLEMVPRKCKIYKLNDNRFLINYLE